MVLEQGARFSDLVVRGRVGRGGMGEVYLVHHAGLDRLEALKVLRGDPEPEVVSRFRGEARIGGRLHHPCIVTVYDLVDVDGQLGLRMEYVEGPDLRAAVRARGPLAPDKAARVVADVADALDAAHRAGVLHRDVKPANVLLPLEAGARDAVLGDFGIGLLEGSARLTSSGFLGTPAYTAPERLSSGAADGAADLYSLACSAFEALTGRPPYVAGNDQAVVRAHLEAPPPSPRAYLAELPAAVDRVFAEALAKDPRDRPPTATAFARALSEALGVSATRAFTAVTARGAHQGNGSHGLNGAAANGSGGGNGAAREGVATRVHEISVHHDDVPRPRRPGGSPERRPGPPDVLVVQVSPQVVDVVPGSTDTVDVRVHNEDRVGHDVEVRVQPSPRCGLAGGVVALLHVPARGHADTTLSVQVPRVSASRPGRHPYHVSVTRRGDDTPADRCGGHVAVGTFDEVAAEMFPGESATRGWGDPVQGRLVLHNRGNRPTVVDAYVRHGPGLRRVLDPVRVTVPAGQSVVYGLRFAPVQPFWLGTPVRHRFSVEAVSSAGLHASASAQLVQKGRVAWWLLLGLLVTLVALVALAVGVA